MNPLDIKQILASLAMGNPLDASGLGIYAHHGGKLNGGWPEQEISPGILNSLMDYRNYSIEGGGNYGNGILSGGGAISANIPITPFLSFSPYVGGGGAFGSVRTPKGKMKIREFSPEGGARLNYRW